MSGGTNSKQIEIGKDNLALLAKASAKEHVINSDYFGLNCN